MSSIDLNVLLMTSEDANNERRSPIHCTDNDRPVLDSRLKCDLDQLIADKFAGILYDWCYLSLTSESCTTTSISSLKDGNESLEPLVNRRHSRYKDRRTGENIMTANEMTVIQLQ